MRVVAFISGLVLTGGLIFALDRSWGPVPPLGRFLSPQQGFWQNAEPVDLDCNLTVDAKGLQEEATVYLDNRLVPHIFTRNEKDAYFLQGYIHARYRLWQMDFNSRAASGRLAEILGDDPRLISYDRQQRRMGMVYGAENHLKAVAADKVMQGVYDAYTAGVNAYINSLTAANMPLEFKLLNYKPEPWSNLKTALFIKLMTSDLAGQGTARDLAFSNQASVFSPEQMRVLYPEVNDSLVPIIPKGTSFGAPGFIPEAPVADTLSNPAANSLGPLAVPDITDMKGSNNWALSGSKTASGAPMLCNDPHLRLTLPSIWFEMQIHTPEMNAYGATFASVPGVVIGFNDHIAWGVTNAGRDVIDYYRVRFKDASRSEYWFQGKWEPTQKRVEKIGARGRDAILDTVAYTYFGPVLYDDSFSYLDSADRPKHTNEGLAMRWIAHDASNDGRMWYDLNRARNYDDYVSAIRHFAAPAQNVVFASKLGDIAIWQQGRFPARWVGQGLYIMPGEDSSHRWQGFIPIEENPHVLNPEQGFVQSANQRAVDASYPYFIPGDYHTPRGVSADMHLAALEGATTADMMALQNNTYNTLAADALPLFYSQLDPDALSETEKRFLDTLSRWNYRADAHSRGQTIYQTWMDSLAAAIWMDEFAAVRKPVTMPAEQTLVEILLRDSTFSFIDNIHTPERETLRQVVTNSFSKAVAALSMKEKETGLLWWKHKQLNILHLLRESLLPFGRKNLEVGGWGNVLNAITKTNGPSWRMIVHLAPTTEAYGVYPGGQSGNPGSRFYNNFVDVWAQGKYYLLWVMDASEANDGRVLGTIKFKPA